MKILHTLLLLGIIGLLYHPSSLSASAATNEIFYAQNQLTVHLKEANLKEVLLAVAKAAQVEFTINKAIADEKVSVQFDKLPLEKGIKKILRPFNHSMIFNSSGRLKNIIILESGSNSTTETIFEDHNIESLITLNQQGVDPLLEDVNPPIRPGGRLEEELSESFDPSVGPAGRLEEESSEGSAGGPGTPGPDGEKTRIPLAGVDYDPAVGPTGRLEAVLPESTTVVPTDPKMKLPFDPTLYPTGQPEDKLSGNTVGPGGF
jgi:hypothetical protein